MQQPTVSGFRRWWVATWLVGLMVAGCGYGEVTPRGYDYAKALYSICNRRDAGRLEEFSRMIETDLQSGEIAQNEADWLREITSQAQAGEWSDAQAATRQLLEDQVEGR